MPDQLDLSALLSGIAKKNMSKKNMGKKRLEVLAPDRPEVPPLHITLYVHIYKCKSCGRTEEHSNRHLIAAYPPCKFNEKYFATTFVGDIPPEVPKVLSYIVEERSHDWCRFCFPATEVNNDPGQAKQPAIEVRPEPPSE